MDRFRGPNGTGESETSTIPASWQPGEENWRIELPGADGHSSPVLWGDKIFLLAPIARRRRVTFCASTRRQESSCGSGLHRRAASSARQQQLCVRHAGLRRRGVFVAWSDPDFTRLMALDHKGNELWTVNLGSWISQHGFGSSPMLYQDLVIINCSQEDSERPGDPQPKESFIVAVEQSTGKIRWRTDRKIDSASYSVCTVRKNEAGQDELLCNTQAEGLFALDPQTGKQNWSAPVLSMAP